MKNIRIKEFDILRGIAILLVVVGHVYQNDSVIAKFIYAFHIPLFFIISGFVMKLDDENSFSSHLKSKVFCSYIFWSFIYINFDLLVNYYVLDRMTTTQVLKNIYSTIVLDGINVLWFLSTLFLSKYLAYCIICKLSRKKALVCSTILFIIVYFTSIVLNNMNIAGIYLLIYYPLLAILRAIAMNLFIVLGFYSKDKVINIIEKHDWRFIIVAIVLIFITAILSKYTGVIDVHYLKFGNIILFISLSIIGSLSMILFSIFIIKIPVISKYLLYFGTNSLFIMATHNYLLVHDIAKYITNLFSINFDERITMLFETLILLFFVHILCILLGNHTDKVINAICIKVKKIKLKNYRK